MTDNPNSDYATILSSSCLFAPKSGTTYSRYHDRYFFEYDAIIASTLHTMDYIKNIEIDKRALTLLNRSWALRILNAYGIDLQYNTHSSYTSPIDFFRFFYDEKFYISEKDKPVLSRLPDSITAYEPNDDITSLIRGYSIPDEYIEKITNIAKGRINTTNFFEELAKIKTSKSEK